MTTFSGQAELVFAMNSSFAISSIAEVSLTRAGTGWSGTALPPADDELGLAMFGSPVEIEIDGAKVTFDVGESDENGVFEVWEMGTRPHLAVPCPRCARDMPRTGSRGDRDAVHGVFNCVPCGTEFCRLHRNAPWETRP